MTCDRVKELASGFVLGSLEADEMIGIEDHLATCLSPHPEIEELGGVLPYLAISLPPVEPPAWLRESVIAAASADVVARRRAGVTGSESKRSAVAMELPGGAQPGQAPRPVAAEVAPSSAKRGRIVSLAAVRASRRTVTSWGLRAAAVVLLVGFGALGASNGVIVPKASPPPFYNIQPGTRVAVLNPPSTQSQAAGLAILMPSGHIYVTVNHLEAAQGDEAYVVWLAAGNGAQSKVGVLKVDGSGTGQLDVENVATSPDIWISICLEPNANVTVSSGPMVLSGTISF
jgi:hypothetical protein